MTIPSIEYNISKIRIHIVHIIYIVYAPGNEDLSLEEGNVKITSEALVKFPKHVEDVISPSLNKEPDRARCSTKFVPAQVLARI